MESTLLAVNGTLMRGLELNPNMRAAGATFVLDDRTDACYWIRSINNRHPEMQRTPGAGTRVALEIWSVPLAGLAAILQNAPPGLAIGRTAPRSEAVAEPEEVLLVDGVQHLDRGALDELVLQRGHAERTLPSVGLTDVRPSHRLGPVAPSGQPVGRLHKVCFQVLPVRLPGLTVHPGCRIAPERVGRLKALDRVDVMHQVGEPRTATTLCSLSYAIERGSHIMVPAGSLGHVRRDGIALGLPPSLHHLRRRRGFTRSLVRRVSSVLCSSPTSRDPGSSLYAHGLFDALCTRRFPARRRRSRDLPVPEQSACARAQGLCPRGVRRCLAMAAASVWPSTYSYSLGTPDHPRLAARGMHCAAQYPTRASPCQRFAHTLTSVSA
jgi:hypothetical protein